MSKDSIVKIFATIGLFVVVSLNVAYAATPVNYVELAPLPGTTCSQVNSAGECTQNSSTEVATGPGGLGYYINGLYKLAVAAASVLAVIMIIIGGFDYVSTDAINNKEEGKSIIKSALGGLLLVLASWIILHTVNPQLVSLKITTQTLQTSDLSALFDMGQAARQANSNAVQRAQQITNNDPNATLNDIGQQATDLRNNVDTIKQNAGTIYNSYDRGEISESDALMYLGQVTGETYTSVDEALYDIQSKTDIMSAKAQAASFAENAKATFDANTTNPRWTNEKVIQNAVNIQTTYEAQKQNINNIPSDLLSQTEKEALLHRLNINAVTSITAVCVNVYNNSEISNQCNALHLSSWATGS